MKRASLNGFTRKRTARLTCVQSDRSGKGPGVKGLGAAPYSAAGAVGLPRYNTGTTPVVGSPAPHMRVGRSRAGPVGVPEPASVSPWWESHPQQQHRTGPRRARPLAVSWDPRPWCCTSVVPHNKTGYRKPCNPLIINGCGGGDLNPRPLGYEPNELPDCSTPRHRLQSQMLTCGFQTRSTNPTGLPVVDVGRSAALDAVFGGHRGGGRGARQT